MKGKNGAEVVGGNTIPRLRWRFFPSFTSFLETEPAWDEKKMKYLIYGAEICPKTGKSHWQGAVYFKNEISLKSAQKLLNIGKSHIETFTKTTTSEAINYCRKDGKFKEFGEEPEQGKRKDLKIIRDEILAGRSVESIGMENPIIYHMYGRTLNWIEDNVMRDKHRTEMTKGIWYWGKSGTGKTHKACEGFTPKTHYMFNNDNGWWDDYKQQDTVIINEFRGSMPYCELLELVDKFPKKVRRRGREPLPFISKLIIVTSVLKPEEVYHNLSERDSLEQLYRRFEVICLNPTSVYIEDSDSECDCDV